VNFEAIVKSIGNDILRILKKTSNIMYAMMEQQEWWTFAKNLHCHIKVAEAEKADFELDENVVGCYHTTCMIGTGFEKTSPIHTDGQSASVKWAGLPDFHLNLAKNINIEFLHYLKVGNNTVQPIIVVQDRLTTTFFYGASTVHGSVHIGTFLDRINLSFEASGHKEWITEVKPEWKVPAELGEERVYITYYTKCTLPVTCEIQRAYSHMGIPPRFCFTTKEGKQGQVAADREMNSIQWDSQLIGTGAKTINEMRDIQCGNSHNNFAVCIQIDTL
jgi:hypothetical protein